MEIQVCIFTTLERPLIASVFRMLAGWRTTYGYNGCDDQDFWAHLYEGSTLHMHTNKTYYIRSNHILLILLVNL
jgi:hypothetical protein